jgi:hypothetical protein
VPVEATAEATMTNDPEAPAVYINVALVVALSVVETGVRNVCKMDPARFVSWKRVVATLAAVPVKFGSMYVKTYFLLAIAAKVKDNIIFSVVVNVSGVVDSTTAAIRPRGHELAAVAERTSPAVNVVFAAMS